MAQTRNSGFLWCFRLSVLALCLGSPLFAQPLTFKTFAGAVDAVGSFDGTGSAARFNRPSDVATDSAGNIYVADEANRTIRKVTPAGVVTTLAGRTGLSGSADGTGSAARFSEPEAVAVDSAGTLYVTDKASHTIRKITPSGVVTTLAGVAGSSGSADGAGPALFNLPAGVATDSSGNIYVADEGNHTIRKISPAGVTSTLAGTAGSSGSADGTGGAARFNSPRGVATDSGGNLYVADSGNHTIRKITPAGLVTTLAGMAGSSGNLNGTGSAARFLAPGRLAADSAGNIYVADTFNHRVRKITPAALVTTLAGTSFGSADGTDIQAQFSFPLGVTTDSGGIVYIADTENHTIRRITPAGMVTTLAGVAGPLGSADGTGSAARFFQPSGLAIDSVGNIFLTERGNNTIRRVNTAGVVTTLAGVAGALGSSDGTGSAARFRRPTGVARGGDGSIYVADTDNHTIRKITSTGMVTTLAGLAGSSGSADGTGSAARFFLPRGVAADSSGNAYVADSSNHTIRKITPDGVVTTLAGMAGFSGSANGMGSEARFNDPGGVTVDLGGNIFIADTFNHTLRLIPNGTNTVRTVAGMAGVSGSADGIDSAVRFFFPEGVASVDVGIVYIADRGNRTIRKLTIDRAVTTLGGTPGFSLTVEGTGSAARFFNPTGVAPDRSGNVFVADTGGHNIWRGEPALPDAAVIDKSFAQVGRALQLDTAPQTATSWSWRVVRQPSNSNAVLSSSSIRNPKFTPDVADLYIFQLTATNGVQTSITTVEVTGITGPPRGRIVRR